MELFFSSLDSFIENIIIMIRPFLFIDKQKQKLSANPYMNQRTHPTCIYNVLVDRKLVSHEWMFPLIPYCSSLCRSLSCGTVSNALEKSKMAMSTCCPLSCSCRKSLIVVISWVSQEYPNQKTTSDQSSLIKRA
jgi:hypothetical protein